MMQIWVDADACPGAIKQILFRAAERVGVRVTLVANQELRTPPSPHIRSIRVKKGFDIADKHIADEMRPGDLVVTADIPLAAEVVGRGGLALNPRGELYTEENVAEHLATRNLLDELRSSGMELTGGPPTFGERDRKEFANQLDRLLTRHVRQADSGGDA